MKGKYKIAKVWAILTVLAFILICVVSLSDRFALKKYHDVQIYSEKTYLDKDKFGEKVYFTGLGARSFLPEFSEITYDYSDIDFYLFNGTATSSNTAVTFVLDLKFEDAERYEEAKQTELSCHAFRTEYADKKWLDCVPLFEFSEGSYVCKTVQNDHYPSRFGLLCYSDDNNSLRYLFFEEWEASGYIQSKEYIIECTNCPWD